MMQNFTVGDFMSILYAFGILAFMVNIIVQMTKEINPIKSIPTKLYVIIVSIIVCFCVLCIKGIVFNMQIICAALMSSFVVGYIAIFGYDNLFETLKKFVKNK